MASALRSYFSTRDVCSEPYALASKRTSINDLPDEILLKILSYFGLEDLCLNIAKVCERWKFLAKDVIMWKKISYDCDQYSYIGRIDEVRCTALLGLGLIRLRILPHLMF